MSAMLTPPSTREEVDAALEAWARWAKSALREVGWTSVNILAKVIKFGVCGAANHAGIKLVEVDELCELVDKALLRLSEDERRVVMVSYFYYQPTEASAKQCHLSVGNFRLLLHKARRSVSDFLEGARLRYNE